MEESVRFKPTGGGSFSPLSVYPVGSIYISVSGTNPSELFGGTWEQLKDRFLLAAGDTYAAGSTGGEAQHTLTEAELPALSGEAGVFPRWRSNPVASGILQQSYNGVIQFPSVQNENCLDGHIRIAFGGDQPHNNLPPYFAMPFWVRTA